MECIKFVKQQFHNLLLFSLSLSLSILSKSILYEESSSSESVCGGNQKNNSGSSPESPVVREKPPDQSSSSSATNADEEFTYARTEFLCYLLTTYQPMPQPSTGAHPVPPMVAIVHLLLSFSCGLCCCY